MKVSNSAINNVAEWINFIAKEVVWLIMVLIIVEDFSSIRFKKIWFNNLEKYKFDK